MKNWTVFAEAAYAANADTLLYTVPAGQTAIIDKCSTYSTAGGTITFYIVPAAGAVGVSNIMGVKTLAALESYTHPEMVGHELAAGDAIYEKAALATTVVRRISGRAGS